MKPNYIPTINISSLVSKDLGSKESLKIIKKIEKACVEVGFFKLLVMVLIIKKLKNCKNWRKIFKLNKKEKIKLSPNKWNKKIKTFIEATFQVT